MAMVVRLMRQLRFPSREGSLLSFLFGAEWNPPGATGRLEGLGQLKNRMSSSGMEPTALRFVAQYPTMINNAKHFVCRTSQDRIKKPDEHVHFFPFDAAWIGNLRRFPFQLCSALHKTTVNKLFSIGSQSEEAFSFNVNLMT
jgi:hypothetical protein